MVTITPATWRCATRTATPTSVATTTCSNAPRTPDGATRSAFVVRPRDESRKLPAALQFTIYAERSAISRAIAVSAFHGDSGAATVDRLLVDPQLAHATVQVGSADAQLVRGLTDVAAVPPQHLQDVVALSLVAKRLERRRRAL